MKLETIKVITDPSFLGAMIGAVITGIIALIVFTVGNRNEIYKRKKLIDNYYKLIKEIHDSTFMSFELFLNVVTNDKELPSDFQIILGELNTQQKILDMINLDEVIKESEEAYKVLTYIVTFRSTFTIIDSAFGAHGRGRHQANGDFVKLESNNKQLLRIFNSIK